jgi:hypothetical protein
MLMVDYGFMTLILMMNINICPMRLLLIIILDNEEYGLDMFYDKALDDPPCVTILTMTWADKTIVPSKDPIILDGPPCETIITSLCEDTNENYILVGCNDTLIHEIPISFLTSPIYIIEEKFALCENYVHSFELSYEKSSCNHAFEIDVNS